jgi:glutamate-ammonia-ligase adenylyltransferase
LQEGVIDQMRKAGDGSASVTPPAILGMGKLGGEEMTAASDLDLIVIYEDGPGGAAAGLSPPQIYARFTQRLISALSAQTAYGALYEVDMRLRPSGKSGPVAVSHAGFKTYQQNQAWTWEHLALTRARIVSGPVHLREKLEADIHEILCSPRDRAKIAADMREMRNLTLKEKDKGDPWDIKNSRGGLLDVEFIAQFLQIAHAAEAPAILSQNTLAALRKLRDAGILNPGDAEVLIDAAQLYQTVQQILRLCTDGRFRPENADAGLKQTLARAANLPDFARLEMELAQSYGAVGALADKILA